jgi:hypothetical protein
MLLMADIRREQDQAGLMQAVSIAYTGMNLSIWIYPEGAIYQGLLLSGPYPCFSEVRLVRDYLNITIKN